MYNIAHVLCNILYTYRYIDRYICVYVYVITEKGPKKVELGMSMTQ